MKNIAIIGGVVLVILGVGYVATSGPQPTATPASETGTPAESADTAIVENESVVDESSEDAATAVAAESEAIDVETETAAASGSYQNYSAVALADSETKTSVLFFAASWCPSCRALDDNIVANQASIPDGVAIFKADYDAETALKQQYGVVRQHSVVVLDANGNQVGSVTHPATLEQLLAAL